MTRPPYLEKYESGTASGEMPLIAAPNAPSEFPAESPKKLQLDYWSLWNRRATLARAAGIALVVSTIIAFLIPNRYESTARIMPPENGLSGLSLAAMASKAAPGVLGAGTALDLLGTKNSGAIAVAVLGSRTALDDVIDRFGLMKVYSVRYREQARKKLARYTDITVDRKSGVITIAVSDRSRERASGIARAYIDELNKISAELNTSAAHRERLFIEERLKEVKAELDSAAKQLADFSTTNATVDIKEQGRAMVEAAAVLQGQIIAAKSQLEGLQQIYTDNNSRVRAARAQVAALERQLEKMTGTAADATSTATASELYPAIRKLPQLAVRYSDLYRQTKVDETVFEVLTQQYELSKIEEAKEFPTVRVLDAPDLPERKSFPPRLVIITLGVLLTVAGTAAFLLYADQWQRLDPRHPWKVVASEFLSRTEFHTRRLTPSFRLHRSRSSRPSSAPE